MATFLELYGERLHRELGSSDTAALFTTARRKAAVNEAQLEWVKQTESFLRQGSVTLADGVREYDLEAAGVISAGDFLWLASQGAEYVFTDTNSTITYTTGDDFPRIDVSTMNRDDAGWRNVAAARTPSSYYLREDGGTTILGIAPKPAIAIGESATVTLPYVAKPTDMTADADEPFTVSSNIKTILRPWHQALVHYAAALLEPLRKNYAAETRQRNLFAAQVADYLQRHRAKGGGRIRFARNYRAEASRMTVRRDPRVY